MAKRVFVSSTRLDLKDCRDAVRDAILRLGFLPEMMELWDASENRPLKECREKVEGCDVVVAIVARRYGWVPDPPDQPVGENKSVTWLECEWAKKNEIPVLAFLLSDEVEWPVDRCERHRVSTAAPGDLVRVAGEVALAEQQLPKFKAWLPTVCTPGYFVNKEELRHKVESALREWAGKRDVAEPKPKDPARFDDLYRAQLEAETRHLEVRGFHIQKGKAVEPLPIEEIYTPLHYQGERGVELLESVLRHRAVLIQGDPGSGKTMFLRRIAFELARKGDPLLAMPHRGFPLLLRISDLDQHVHECLARHTGDAPTQKDDPRWLAHALASRMNAPPCEFFEAKLGDTETVVLLDGLDEAQSEERRDTVAAIIRRAARQLPCRFVVTSRPSLRQDNEPGFARVTIADLEPASRTHFLTKWSQVLYSNDPSAATRNRENLEAALATRPDVEEMARSPLMLTAIAVIYWNDGRLPDHRAALYSAVVNWLAAARVRPGVNTDEYLRRFSTLAFAMQADQAGRQVSVDLTKAARDLAPVPFEEAKKFLQAEEAESGMIVSRGGGIAFKHLTFQEYLAAYHLDGLMDFIPETAAQPSRIYQPEWREVMCLLAGRLSQPRAQHLVDAMIAQCGNDLEARARCVDLLSAMIGERPGFEAGDAYRDLARCMLALFEDTEENRKIPAKVRAVAAEALGVFGTKRLRKPSDPDYWVALRPSPGAKLQPFQIGRFPVTVFEYKDFVDRGYAAPRDWKRQIEVPSRPVVNLTWHDAAAYAESMGCRLPTADEWEFAASGEERREYPWGNAEPDATRANYDQAGVGHPTPVGLFPRGNTPNGIGDLAGNVWEWTSTDYDANSKETRGGSFHDYGRALRCSYRLRDGPGYWVHFQGFRCARDMKRAPLRRSLAARAGAVKAAPGVLLHFLAARRTQAFPASNMNDPRPRGSSMRSPAGGEGRGAWCWHIPDLNRARRD